MTNLNISKKTLTSAIRKDVRAEHGWDEAQAWVEHDRMDNYTPEELARVKTLQEQWTALCAQGEDEGWLEWTNDYSGSHLEVVERLTHPTRRALIRESEQERRDRLDYLSERIEEEVTQRVEKQWKALQEAKAVLSRIGK